MKEGRTYVFYFSPEGAGKIPIFLKLTAGGAMKKYYAVRKEAKFIT